MRHLDRKWIGLIFAALMIVTCGILELTRASSKLPLEGACLLLAALVLWMTEALPMSITTMFMICMLAAFNIMSFDEAVANIGVNTSLFIMASSGITIAVAGSNLPYFMTRAIVARTEGNPIKMVIGLGFLISICSAFMSSLATCALFYGIISSMLTDNGYRPGESNLGRCLMIAIPACAGIGGFMSPAGTPANILLIDVLNSNGVSIAFGKWCVIGFPMGLLAVGVFLAALVMVFHPEKFILQQGESATAVKVWRSDDLKTAGIVIAIIVFWFLSSWIRSLNTTMIAVIGLFIMFLPGIKLMNWEKFSTGVNWDLVLTMGTVSVLMNGISKTGLMSIITSSITNYISGCSVVFALIIVSLTVCVIRAFVPTTTAVVALLAPMLIEVSALRGISVASLLFILAFWTASALLVVYTEPIYLITFSSKYYRGSDLLKVGTLPCLILACLTAFIIPILVKLII